MESVHRNHHTVGCIQYRFDLIWFFDCTCTVIINDIPEHDRINLLGVWKKLDYQMNLLGSVRSGPVDIHRYACIPFRNLCDSHHIVLYWRPQPPLRQHFHFYFPLYSTTTPLHYTTTTWWWWYFSSDSSTGSNFWTILYAATPLTKGVHCCSSSDINWFVSLADFNTIPHTIDRGNAWWMCCSHSVDVIFCISFFPIVFKEEAYPFLSQSCVDGCFCEWIIEQKIGIQKTERTRNEKNKRTLLGNTRCRFW